MKTALDFYERGKQKESNADDYDKNGYYSKGRFICPECGEPVFLAKKSSNYFAHYKKKDETAECERRVDGNLSESFYERMGLPIFLRKNINGKFSLYMGFGALPPKIMNMAEQCNASVNVNGRIKININKERFSMDEPTMIPIDYIPKSRQKLFVGYYPENIKSILEKYWSNYADGFSPEGAIFTVTERGGRKVRRGDNIATDTDYYWVRRQMSLPYFYKGLRMTRVGQICTKECNLNVFRGCFDSNIEDYKYKFLSNFLRERLGVHLLEKKPEFIPLWPPMTKQEDGYHYNENANKVYGHVISGNECPKIYLYRDISYDAELLYRQNEIVEFSTFGSTIIINIDRKYTSGGTGFIPRIVNINSVGSDCLINQEEHRVEVSGLNSKVIYMVRNIGSIERVNNIDNYAINDFYYNDKIYIVSHRYVLHKLFCDFKDKDTGKKDESKLLEILLKKQNEKMIFLPEDLRKRLQRCEFSNLLLKQKVLNILKQNRIAASIIPLWEGDLDGTK